MKKVIAMQLSPHIGTTRRKTTGETCQIRLMVQQRKKKISGWVWCRVRYLCVLSAYIFSISFLCDWKMVIKSSRFFAVNQNSSVSLINHHQVLM